MSWDDLARERGPYRPSAKQTALHLARIRQQDPHPFELAMGMLDRCYPSLKARDQ